LSFFSTLPLFEVGHLPPNLPKVPLLLDDPPLEVVNPFCKKGDPRLTILYNLDSLFEALQSNDPPL